MVSTEHLLSYLADVSNDLLCISNVYFADVINYLCTGGDQGLLNKYWSDWATKDIKFHLPFTFNVVPNVTYGYAPAYQR